MAKKGQAAMEFLMTYGWAILAAVIVIGVLWYVVGNPANLVGDKFLVSQPFVKSAMALSTSAVSLEVTNGAGEAVTVTSAALSNCGTNSSSLSVADGAKQVISITCSPALTSGSRFKGDLTISYTTSGSSLTQSATGSVSGKVP